MPKGKHKTVTKAKAKKILKHGEVKGHPLTKKQKGFFGARAGGAPVKRNPPRKKTTTRPRTARRKTSSSSRKRR